MLELQAIVQIQADSIQFIEFCALLLEVLIAQFAQLLHIAAQ